MGAARRLIDRPIIYPGMLPGADGSNINGASLILAPDWLAHRLGRFYIYFAHHTGRYIRLAYADDLAGPWKVHQPGTLTLEEAPGCRGHIASPDVHVDTAAREIVMFFHGPVRGATGQRTFLARSADGIRFTAGSEQIADFYLRVAPWRDRWLGMAKGGVMYASDALRGKYRQLPARVFPDVVAPREVRHVALRVVGDTLRVLYSAIGDAPERIYEATVDLTAPVEVWKGVDTRLVLAPERIWEGAGLPVSVSRSGAAHGPEHALRDPAVFSWGGTTYLIYAVAGESGIGIAELSNPEAASLADA